MSRGPRFRLTVNTDGLEGANACAARMVASAMLHRDSAFRVQADLLKPGFRDSGFYALAVKLSRHSMRESALWARRFAKSIADEDPRWEELRKAYEPLREQLDSYQRAHDAANPA